LRVSKERGRGRWIDRRQALREVMANRGRRAQVGPKFYGLTPSMPSTLASGEAPIERAESVH